MRTAPVAICSRDAKLTIFASRRERLKRGLILMRKSDAAGYRVAKWIPLRRQNLQSPSAGQEPALRPICFKCHSEVEMSNPELSDYQLLDEARAALREKDIERAKPLFAEFSERSVAKVKAKVANDPA